MNKLFLSSIAKAINAYLQLDPESISHLNKLNGKTITIELLPFHFIFHCQFHDEKVEISTDACLQTNAKIIGTPLQMLGVMIDKHNRNKAFADDLSIEGDAEIANEVVKLFDELQIDWAEYASRIAGDVPVHYAGRLIRTARNFATHINQSFAQNVTEYVHEEKEWLPSRERLNDLFTDIDSLRMDVDRAEARINHLRHCMTEKGHHYSQDPTIKPRDNGSEINDEGCQ